MPVLTTEAEERNQAFGQFQAGFRVTEISERFGCSRQALYKMKHKYEVHHSMKDRPRTGRPQSTTQEIDDAIVDAHERNPFKSVSSTAAEAKVSKYTVIRRLSDFKLHACRPVIKPKF